MKPLRMKLDIDFAPRKTTQRKVEHAAGETAAMMQEAIDDLRPVALRAAQRGEQHAAAAIAAAVVTLELGKRYLAKLSRYAKEY